MKTLVQKLSEVIESMKLINVVSTTDAKYNIIIENNKICTIDADKKIYTSFLKEGCEDIYRVLHWFNFRDVNINTDEKEKCNGLNCEDCSGCAYNTLTSLFKARKVLEGYVDRTILESYVFIGSHKVSDELIAVSDYKKYISFIDGKYHICSGGDFYKEEYGVDELKQVLRSLFIEQYIPEILRIPDTINQVYGVYKNKAVLWQMKVINQRKCWDYTTL